MAFIGGFLGGGVRMVPAGHGQLCLQWSTPDRLNLRGASFVIEGIGGTSGSFSVDASDDGRAEIMIPVGDYTVSVHHTGYYSNDKPQRVTVRSTESYLVLFGGVAHDYNVFVQSYEPEEAELGDIWIREVFD